MSRWQVPEGIPANLKTVLRFQLDQAGSARKVEVVTSDDPRLGRSAQQAPQAASPFPPMDDNNRCLAGRSLTGTFRNPDGG